MAPVYDESIEEAFPILKEMEERRERLLVAAHRKRAHLVEHMAAAGDSEEDEEEGDSGDEGKTENTRPRPRRVDIDMRRYKARGLRRHATLADLPKEDIFGRPIPSTASQKTFPSVGRRLGGEGETSRSVWMSPLGDLDIEWMDIVLAAFVTTVLIGLTVRILSRIRGGARAPQRLDAYSNENHRLNAEMAKLSNTLERMDRMLVANEQQTRMLATLTMMARGVDTGTTAPSPVNSA